MRRAPLPLVLAALLAPQVSACFDGRGLEGAPCLSDEDCGPAFTCESSVCGGGGSGSGEGRWPDSPTAASYCSDGSVEVEPCPAPGEPGYGQDGNYETKLPNYSREGGVILDSVTGLAWETDSTQSNLSQAAAADRCNNLQLEGRDWRLPSRLELASLIDYGRSPPFSGIYEGRHWSSSNAAQDGMAWAVSFVNFDTTVETASDEYSSICVSGPPLVSAFAVGDDTITDGMTGLEWQRGYSPDAMTWLDALNYCEGLSLAGAEDWRLPSAKELITLARDDQSPVEGLEGDDRFWTSTPGSLPERAFNFRLPAGTHGADTTIIVHVVRCVRAGD